MSRGSTTGRPPPPGPGRGGIRTAGARTATRPGCHRRHLLAGHVGHPPGQTPGWPLPGRRGPGPRSSGAPRRCGGPGGAAPARGRRRPAPGRPPPTPRPGSGSSPSARQPGRSPAGQVRGDSSQTGGPTAPVAWAMSPTTVIDPDRDRRASMRSCIGDRSCTSSTTMCPYVRTPSASARVGRLGLGRARRPVPDLLAGLGATGPRRSRARRVRARCGPRRPGRRRRPSTDLVERGAAGRAAAARAVSMPWPAAARSGGRRRGRGGARGGQPGPHPVEGLGQLGDPAHLARPKSSKSSSSSASSDGSPSARRIELRSTRRRDRPASRAGLLGLPGPVGQQRTTCCSTKRRRALWVPGRRRATATISAVARR